MWIRKVILIIFLFSGSLAVTTIATAGEASLSWDPPTTNTDGSPLTDLGGFMVYYGTSPGIYEYTTDAGNQLTWNVINLTEGRVFFFAVSAYDIFGNESGFSNEVSKVIQALPAGNIDVSTSASVNRVDGYDLISLELSLGTTPDSAGWNPVADLDGNGMIDQQDLNILIGNFGAAK